ncbi:hypothetical protein E2562_023681 [Oryza meyeriana var. granulata]|uniref:Tuftelin interacting protein N-terminal domain-containing protein n=1 Tax=Oryza meyeriana var. granulata TaxID=110450 RepID=A0A6G1BMY9_9ORYZ|nr:hypothetical protein E2562_023681 [Oryza meyeriana var. granulata]
MDGDFEGGRFGRDGEFYYERRRESATQTRDDKLYGVFAEGDSDYDSEDDAGNRRRRRKRRRDESEPDLSRPVQLQSAGKFMPTKEAEAEERPGLGAAAAAEDAAEEPEELDLPTAFGQRIAEGARARREERVGGSREAAAGSGEFGVQHEGGQYDGYDGVQERDGAWQERAG